MIKSLISSIALCCCLHAQAQMNYPVIQCLSGDCNNGTGVADLEDFHVYRGEFKNGKPEGKGMLLHYDRDGEVPEYIGEFKNGAASGTGTSIIESNKIYAEGSFAEGWFIKGEMHLDGKWVAKINAATKEKYNALYSGTLYEGEQKKNDFTNTNLFTLKEKIRPAQAKATNAAASPNLTKQIDTDLKTMIETLEKKFEITDKIYTLYIEMLECLPDDVYCGQNRVNIMADMIPIYTEYEAANLDKTMVRLAENIAQYRSASNISENHRKDAGEVMPLIVRIKSAYLDACTDEVQSGVVKAFKDAVSQYSKGNVSVMRTNARFSQNSRRQDRQRDLEILKTLAVIFKY